MMRRQRLIYTVMAVMLPLSTVFAQEQLTMRERAAQSFQRYHYAQSAELYAQLADRNNPRLQDLEYAAESYYMMRDFAAAETWYAQAVQHKDHLPHHVLRYADVLKANGKYEEAKGQYHAYAELSGDARAVEVRIAGCDSALLWKLNPTLHKLRNEEGINTGASEFSVSVIGDDIYFAGESGQPGRAPADLYGWTGRPFVKLHKTSVGQSLHLTAPALADAELNDKDYHVGPVASPDNGQTLFVTHTYEGKGGNSERVGRTKYRTQRLTLYQYSWQNGGWAVTPFVYNDPDQYSVGHAAFSADGRTLYFASDRPGGLGGTDIWFSERQGDGTWGQPVNAGPQINTSGDELFPVIGADGKLYYSTDGLAGMGGLDIFQAAGSKDQWSSPVNLGYPLNSPHDDFSFITVQDNDEAQSGYLSSNRQGGQGEDDIYSFQFIKPKPEPVVIVLQGLTINKSTNEQLADASVVLYEGNREIVGRRSSSTDGAFEFVIEPGKEYEVYGSKARFYPDSARTSSLNITRSDTLFVSLALEPELVKGRTFVLENLYYDFDKHHIRPDAALVLDELVQTMIENPTLKIELSSHTDSRGNDAYNMALSERRARAAVEYIISKGISRDRLEARGYGETRLINECANGVQCSEEQHQANRRTEVKVLDI